PTNLSLGVGFPDGGKSYNTRFGMSQERFFGGAGIDYTSADDFDATATGISLDAGLSLARRSDESTLQLCPVASATFTFGPNFDMFDVEMEIRSQAYAAGMAAGGTVVVSPILSVVPNASLSLLHLRGKVTATSGTESESASDSDTGGLLFAGVSFVFNDIFAVRPGVSIPIGFEGGDATIQIRLSMGFGGRRE